MKMTRFLVAALALSSLSSCALIGSALKIPGSLLRTIGRTAGVTNLTDAPAQPATEPINQETKADSPAQPAAD